MILLSTVLCNNWKIIQINYVLDFTQEPIKMECYMKTPKDIEVQSDSEWLQKVKKTVYRQLKEGRVRNKLLVEKLTSSAVGFRKSKVDECVFYRGEIINILYNKYSILKVPDEE